MALRGACRGALWAAGLALAHPGLAAEAPPGAAPPAVDRVLLVTIDTLRADHVGVLGGPVPTPAIDGLAAQGVVLEQAFTPTPTTGPAHASLLTGLHPWRHGALDNAVPLDPRMPTLADAARARGLETAAFVSNYMLGRRFGFHQGFGTFWFEPSEAYDWQGTRRERFWTRGEHTTRAAMHWLTEHVDRPFFVWVHYFDPHRPYRPPPGFAVSPHQPVDLEGKLLPPGVKKPRELKQLIRAYRGEVTYADAQVGTLLQRLELLGLLERTAVVVTSDHGEGLGDHGLLQHGANLFDELVRIPLVLRAPGVPAGRRLRGPVQLEDLSATLLSLIGAPPFAEMDGLDLLPWLRGETEQPPRTAVVGRRKPMRRLREQYYERREASKWIGALERPGMVFELSSDPREVSPTRGEGPPAALERALERAREADALRAGSVDPDPEVRRALKALGYSE